MAILGFTASAFDVLHAGHIAMLEEAASLCDTLICGLHVDPSVERPEKSRPVQPLSERYVQLAAIRYVDKIIPYQTEEELLQLIALVHPNIRFLGEEYRDKAFTGKELCETLGIRIHYNSRKHSLSSTLQRARLVHGYSSYRT
jgi:glycerol-3-phosphate cytidylyltransferase